MNSSAGQNPNLSCQQQLVMTYGHGMIENWMKNHLVSDSNCNTID